MSNAKEIKERMGSIQETKKITNAMYLISSSKMKQAKKKLSDTEPFFYGMQAEIARITGLSEGNVRVRIHRIKALLTKKIRAYEE